VNPQVDDYDETLTILGNASLASKIREFADVGRVAAHSQAPPSHFQTASLASSGPLAVSASGTATAGTAAGVGTTRAAASKIEEKTLANATTAAGAKRKRADHNTTVTAKETRATRKTSKSSTAHVASAKTSLESIPDLLETTTESDQQPAVESERKRLRREVQDLQESNAQLVSQSYSRESEIRAEVSQEMVLRSTHLLTQIQELRNKLSRYEMQQVDDVTKSVRKVHNKQLLAAQEDALNDLQEAEDEIERLKTEHEIEVFKLKAENKKLSTDLAAARQQLAAYQIETGPSRLKKVFGGGSGKSATVEEQENLAGPAFQRQLSHNALQVEPSLSAPGLVKQKSQSPNRSPLTAISSNQLNASPVRSMSPLKSQHNDLFMQNKSPINLSALAEVTRHGNSSGNGDQQQQSMGSPHFTSEATPYFKKLRSHFGRA
jgi:hypothetical protein